MFFTKQPTAGYRTNMTVGDAVNGLQAFNSLYALQYADGNPTAVNGDTNATAQWRAAVQNIINVGGEKVEIDFFEQIFGGKTKMVDAKKIYFRYNDDVDLNIAAQDNAVALNPADGVWFTLSRALHSSDGKYSTLAEGYSIYNYEDQQMLKIEQIDKSVDGAHKALVYGYKKTYTVNIRKGSKMMLVPTHLVPGLTTFRPASTQQTIGYTNFIRPFRLKNEWELALDLNKGYENILQWGIMFDPETGKEVDAWEPFKKTAARRDMKWAMNLIFFLGQSIDNPNLISANEDGSSKISSQYSGFDGYVPSIQNGGGMEIDYDPGVGFDMESDFDPIIMRNDALKQTTEFLLLCATPFLMSLTKRANQTFKANSGACTFDTFSRMGDGDNSSAIKKLEVTSYSYQGYSFHTKKISALNDSRGIGNYNIPFRGHMIPGNGLKDITGAAVPAMEFFMPQGPSGDSGMFEEENIDFRKTIGVEKVGGYIAQTTMATVHAPHQHIIINPEMN